MNKIERKINKSLNQVGIYPHDGESVVFIRKGELHKGEVIGNVALTGHTPLAEIGSVGLMDLRNEVAAARGERPAVTSRKLHRGEMLVYKEQNK